MAFRALLLPALVYVLSGVPGKASQHGLRNKINNMLSHENAIHAPPRLPPAAYESAPAGYWVDVAGIQCPFCYFNNAMQPWDWCDDQCADIMSTFPQRCEEAPDIETCETCMPAYCNRPRPQTTPE